MESNEVVPLEPTWRRMAELQLHPRNYRLGDVESIITSIRKFGFNGVLRVRDGFVLGGNHALKALRQLHEKRPNRPPHGIRLDESGDWLVQCLDLSHLSEEEAIAFMVADNRTQELGENNDEALRSILEELMKLAPDAFEATGYTSDDLQDLLDKIGEDESDLDAEAKVDEAEKLLEKWKVEPGQLWVIPSRTGGGDHLLLCGDSTVASNVERVLQGRRPAIMVTDPPYGVEYDPEWRHEVLGSTVIGNKVANDDRVDWSAAYKLSNAPVVYVWHAGLFADQVKQSMEAVDYEIRSQIIWAKAGPVIGRGHYHWQHEPCQPPGTLVRTPKGEVPIECLKDGDRVLSYDSYSSVITGKRDGRQVRVANRHYTGELYRVSVAGRSTACTDGHRFSIRFAPEHAETWCTYLMRRGEWWRVGALKLYNSRGFGLKIRMEQEQADEAWLLGVHYNKMDALCAEQVLSVKYGIPTTHWCVDRAVKGTTYRSLDQIQSIYARLDLHVMRAGASQALLDHGRRMEYPLVDAVSAPIPFSRLKTTLVRASNLIPEIMQVPIPKPTGDEFTWESIVNVERELYDGSVFSLDVETDHHYIADGIVTHNCWYAVLKGEDAFWQGDRKQTTIWEAANRTQAGGEGFTVGHATQKPVTLYEKAYRNHCRRGQVVYEPFSGSGTAFVAAERLGLLCAGIELEPKFVAVILERCKEIGLVPTLEKATEIA